MSIDRFNDDNGYAGTRNNRSFWTDEDDEDDEDDDQMSIEELQEIGEYLINRNPSPPADPGKDGDA